MTKGKKAFTLIELLTVIAIIAILSGIIVPVYARVKDNANRSNDISHMNQLRTALGLYREDQGAYPPQLLGYVTLYSSGPDAGNVMPASVVQGFLYSKRVGSLDTFRPAYNRVSPAAVVNAVFPTQDPLALGNFVPGLDLNGDGNTTAADDTLGSRQAFGPADGFVCWDPSISAVAAGGTRCSGVTLSDPADVRARMFYSISGYDVANVPLAGGSSQNELRYARFWTNYAIGVGAGFGNGDPSDDPRQMGYTNPPDNTVVTWNSYFREYSSPGVPQRIRKDIILFLNGSARPWDSRALADAAWRQKAD